MSTQKSMRKKISSVLAAATVALVAASGLALAPTAAFAEPVAGSITGSATVTSATEAGINVDVAVAGIADAAATYPNGVHVGIVTRGSADGAVQDDFIGATASIGRAGSMPADGTVAASVAVPAADLDRTMQYEAVVWPQRSNPSVANIVKVLEFDVTEAQWDAVFPAVASISTEVTSASTEGLKLSATIEGITLRAAEDVPDTNKADVGAYVAVIEKSKVSELANGADAAVVADFAYKSFISDGAVTRSLTAPSAKLDRTKQYVVVTWRAHGNLNDDRFLAQTDLVVTAAQWNAVFPSPAPTLVPKVTKASTTGLDVKADLKNIVSSTGAYVSLIEAGTSNQLTAENMGIGVDWVTPQRFTDGSAVASLKAPADKLDRTKSYEVISWRGHTLPTSETIFNVAPLTVTAAQWDAIFKKDEPKPEVKVPFTDVKKGDKFFKEISWMFTAKVTTGVKQADGTVKYVPKGNVTREAMAAFLFRQYGDASYVAPKTSVFTDVKPGDKFYKEIAWMADKGYSTGIKQAGGKTFMYQPKQNVTREAMAAFIYRIEKNTPATKKVSFNDVKPGHKFYKEISWMGGTGVSTGNKLSNGTYDYKPSDSVTREAMAAFMQRADAL